MFPANPVAEGKWASDSISPPCLLITKHSLLGFPVCFLLHSSGFPDPSLRWLQVSLFLALQLKFKSDDGPIFK
jgi:hypothetical protein